MWLVVTSACCPDAETYAGIYSSLKRAKHFVEEHASDPINWFYEDQNNWYGSGDRRHSDTYHLRCVNVDEEIQQMVA